MKLQLHRDTLRTLESREVEAVRGGATLRASCNLDSCPHSDCVCPSDYISCQLSFVC